MNMRHRLRHCIDARMQSVDRKHLPSATAAMYGRACMLVEVWGGGGLTSAVVEEMHLSERWGCWHAEDVAAGRMQLLAAVAGPLEQPG